jgi:membrane-bound lytic murein transglycosylase D
MIFQSTEHKYTLLLCTAILLHTGVFAQLDMIRQEPLTTTTLLSGNEEVHQKTVMADPKQNFRNLFVKGTSAGLGGTSSALSTEHLNPRAIGFVQDYMEKHSAHLREMRSWAKPYFDMMDDVLMQNGIPKELKYLAVIESNLRATAVSWAGAVGPWQFMPGTARLNGLQVGRGVDERMDYLKSTKAASRYLNQLYDLYEDWLLVVAAYNCGPGRVNSAIQRSGSSDFWNLQMYLPAESRNHVKKFIATHYIMEGQGGPTTMTREQAMALAPVLDAATHQEVKVQTVSGRYNSKAVAKYLEMTQAEFNKLNPNMDRILAGNKTYQLRIPVDKVDLFYMKKNEMLNESIKMILDPGYRM